MVVHHMYRAGIIERAFRVMHAITPNTLHPWQKRIRLAQLGPLVAKILRQTRIARDGGRFPRSRHSVEFRNGRCFYLTRLVLRSGQSRPRNRLRAWSAATGRTFRARRNCTFIRAGSIPRRRTVKRNASPHSCTLSFRRKSNPARLRMCPLVSRIRMACNRQEGHAGRHISRPR